MKQPRLRLALLAAVALIALPALLPAPAGAASRSLGSGTIVVTLDPFFATFVGAGYPLYPFAPAVEPFNVPGPRVVMPVYGGTWNTSTLQGTFRSKGGIVFIHYAAGTLRTLTLPAWRAGVGTTAGWTALVNGTRTTILTQSLTGMNITLPRIHGRTYVRVTGIALSYNANFLSAFNAAFAAGLTVEPLGTATLQAPLK
jgi:hypothetical protein